MSLQTRRELLARVGPRYRAASWLEKGRILDEFVAATGYGRKYAVTLLNRPRVDESSPRERRRQRRYDEPVQQALVSVWKAANGICSKRLVPFLPEFVCALERFGHLALESDVRERLLSMSVATADRLLCAQRHPGGRGVSTTRPGKLLKRQIPVRTFADWNEVTPGFVEADLVAHCADTAEGSFLNTLVLTDIATGWTECLALLRRSEADVAGALGQARRQLPFALLGLDTDNGGEFINYEMLGYCEREKITFTRSRTYKKNDQAHVEEKNGSVVRRLVGYDRYEGVEAWRALSGLYRALRLYVNFFQPSLKLLSKQRDGGRVTKRYDRAQTPYQRVLAASAIAEERKEELRQRYNELDPVALLGELERLQDQLWQHAWNRAPVRESACLRREAVQEPAPRSPEAAEVALPRPSVPPEAKQPVPRLYRKTKKEPVPHTWRTRVDPFSGVWGQVRLQLQIDPSQTARQLFEGLQAQYPGQFPDGQLRTLQRRVKEWRREHLYSEEATWNGFYANVVRPVDDLSALSASERALV